MNFGDIALNKKDYYEKGCNDSCANYGWKCFSCCRYNYYNNCCGRYRVTSETHIGFSIE